MSKKKIIIIAASVLILVIGGLAAGAYFYVESKIHANTKPEDLFVDSNEEQKAIYSEESGVFNILLCGLDGRKKDADSRTDSIIVANIDTNKKSVRLLSFMRDLYVPIPDHGQTRINSAFAIGGPELLIKTLNHDFNLNIRYYATIDFKAFQKMVDVVGGIDVEVKEYELDQLNYYIKEANWKSPDYIKQAGFQHLNGQQALSYCRIRKVGNNDYERTERQRKVLSLLITKAKKTSMFKLPELFTAILPYIKTNLPTNKAANLGYTVYRFGSLSVNTARIPADGMFQGMKINGADVLVPDMDKSVAYIDNFLTSNGSIGNYNMPAYMANDYHVNDIAVDKRKKKLNAVQIVIPKNSKKSNTLEPAKNDNNKIELDLLEGATSNGSNQPTITQSPQPSVDTGIPDATGESNAGQNPGGTGAGAATGTGNGSTDNSTTSSAIGN